MKNIYSILFAMFFVFSAIEGIAQSKDEALNLLKAQTTTEITNAKAKATEMLSAIEISEQKLIESKSSMKGNTEALTNLEKELTQLKETKGFYLKVKSKQTPADIIKRLEEQINNPKINPKNADALKVRLETMKKLDI